MFKTIQEHIADMNKTDEVCLKGVDSGRGFNASVLSLHQSFVPVLSQHPNNRGSITLVLKEGDFVKLARLHGYNI